MTPSDPQRPKLPIDDVLAELRSVLTRSNRAVLIAPPGAGKTTIVPLDLLTADWLDGRRILVLEPRRIAARAAAARMASLLGEPVGQTVGLRARLASKVSSGTRVEVITEGVFTRMIVDDPGLDGVGAVLFDEFHERSLDADFGLALALDSQAGLRDDLRLLVMSATIDGGRIAATLGDAPVIKSDGKIFPVTTRYIGRQSEERLAVAMSSAIRRALREESGSILAFLPGQAEIRRTADNLNEALAGDDANVLVARLYGAMDLDQQAAAVRPAETGKRKVVLATAIAETSLTIEGVRIVIDSGFARIPRYDPGARMTWLDTVRVSLASANQRRGRAGRTEPGICYRLWHEAETQGLRPFETPEIRNADLSSIVLDCAACGITDPTMLKWLDPPPSGAIEAVQATLIDVGALDQRNQITAVGRALRQLPLPVHLARMTIAGARADVAVMAAELAAVIMERGLGGRTTDLDERLQVFQRDQSSRSRQHRELARRWARTANRLVQELQPELQQELQDEFGHDASTSVAGLLANAYPDRIAQCRDGGRRYLTAGGRGAQLTPDDPLVGTPYLVIAEMQGAVRDARITAAARLDEVGLAAAAGSRIVEEDRLEFDSSRAAVASRRVRRLGSIRVAEVPVPIIDNELAAHELGRGVAEHVGIDRLPWSKAQGQLRARTAFLRSSDPTWPDLSATALAENLADWLVPFLFGKRAVSEITASDLGSALDVLLPWDLRRRLEDAAPTHFLAPSGNRHAIDYAGEHAPSVALRVQEVFGLTAHPTIADGRRRLVLTLLSPAGRPIQVTDDLPGFWAGSWREVRVEMKGRYPKHVWPDDPASAAATTRAKPRKGT